MIEIDKEEDSVDLMFFDEVVDKSNKGKAISDGYSDYEAQVCGLTSIKIYSFV